ncbi:hypothetical protein Bca52824_067605 [Brassica carinata]|uniref:Microtubule-binding protein TANGLED n=1 Tax=Brassica carinata TaxID=52824 RepID=A0A8X7QM92_BRACI|nr:hypothetical protein Bca52824_067605 [Brassica carinata]
MVARTPQKQRKVAMVVAPPLNSDLLRETINKVDKCMERLQELQYTIAGGTKVVSGVNLSPRSTRTYLKTSLRCKQETLRIKNATNKKSPIGKFPASSPGDWRKMSLPAMLLGETVNEILQASQVTRDIVDALAPNKSRKSRRSTMPEEEEDEREAEQTVRTNFPRARSRIVFKVVSPHKTAEKVQHLANRVSPKHKPWVKKAVLFPNPLFISGSSTQQAKFSRTMSPVIASSKNTKKETPHKFLIKSPSKSPSKFQVRIKSPPKVSVSPNRNGSNLARKSPTRSVSLGRKSPPKLSAAGKLRRSFTPTRNGSNVARKSSISQKSHPSSFHISVKKR